MIDYSMWFLMGKKDGCLVTSQLFFQFCGVPVGFLVESDIGWLEIGQELGVVVGVFFFPSM